jgi:hypothetical protein
MNARRGIHSAPRAIVFIHGGLHSRDLLTFRPHPQNLSALNPLPATKPAANFRKVEVRPRSIFALSFERRRNAKKYGGFNFLARSGT